jgi:phosphoribosylanthranilate isomerase
MEDEVTDTVTRIKICGIINLEDALAAVKYGANALGFNFVPATPRYVGDGVAQIPSRLPPFISAVAVCADLSAAPIPIRYGLDFDTVQYYTDASGSASTYGARRLVRACRIQDERSLEEISSTIAGFRPHALLLDAYHPDKLGGAGKTFNWDLAVEVKERFALPIILAGGLTQDNVGDAIRAVRPYAVDVSSGVEVEPGRKDHERLRAFMQAVRDADRT